MRVLLVMFTGVLLLGGFVSALLMIVAPRKSGVFDALTGREERLDGGRYRGDWRQDSITRLLGAGLLYMTSLGIYRMIEGLGTKLPLSAPESVEPQSTIFNYVVPTALLVVGGALLLRPRPFLPWFRRAYFKRHLLDGKKIEQAVRALAIGFIGIGILMILFAYFRVD